MKAFLHTSRTFFDAEMATLAAEITANCGPTQWPITIGLERTPLGALVWRAFLENRGVTTEASADEPSTAIAKALLAFRKTNPELA